MPPISRNRLRPSGESNGHLPQNGASRQDNELIALYEELNALWNRAEAELASLRVPHDVRIYLDEGYAFGEPDYSEGTQRDFLGYAKVNGDWRIVWGQAVSPTNDNCYWTYKPLAECPVEKRVELAPRFKELRSEVRDARQSYIPKVAKAIEELKATLAS